MSRTAVVVGVGPGLGEAVARRFAREGCNVALVARSEEYLEDLSADLREDGGAAQAVPMDITDPEAVAEGFETIRDDFGSIDALIDCVYSTETADGGIEEVDIDALRGAWRVETEGAFRCVKAALPDLLDDGGTVIFTNSSQSKRASAEEFTRSIARFGLRGFAQGLARDLGPKGIHVTHVLIEGWINKPSLREFAPDRPDEQWIDPVEVADTYWRLVTQDRSAWTFELDLRPYTDSIDV
jgi:NAD(P)-dependent dehydrogenase (short-subunit alcohol dehydrogenase family)